jgi:PEP-CTERM motif
MQVISSAVPLRLSPTLRMKTLAAAALTATLAASLPAAAASVAFDGSLFRSNPPAGSGGRCAPAMTVINDPIAHTSTGTSTLGSFLNWSSACIVPPPPTTTYDGVFHFDFGGGHTLDGTTYSNVTLGTTPGLFVINGFFNVTEGTGKFLGASGAFEEIGTLDFRTPGVAVAAGDFRGTLNLAPVPEPAAWALMLGGLCAVGALTRQRRVTSGRR